MAGYTVLVLAGGDSAERDVSLSSARGIAAALRDAGHRVLIADPARPEVAPTEYDEAIFGSGAIPAEPPALGGDVHTARAAFVKILAQREAFKIDVVFNGLHGGAGEDGTVQAVLEYLGVPYTGSGPAASAFAMDKQRAKILCAAAGVPVPPGLHLERSALAAGTLEQQVREHVGLPAVVKPNAQGSSVGLTVVRSFGEIDEAARRAFEADRSVLIERFIEGRELTHAVLEGGPELPVLEIRPKSGLYDYFHKYQSGNTEYLVPAPVDAKVDAPGRGIVAARVRSTRALDLCAHGLPARPGGRPLHARGEYAAGHDVVESGAEIRGRGGDLLHRAVRPHRAPLPRSLQLTSTVPPRVLSSRHPAGFATRGPRLDATRCHPRHISASPVRRPLAATRGSQDGTLTSSERACYSVPPWRCVFTIRSGRRSPTLCPSIPAKSGCTSAV